MSGITDLPFRMLNRSFGAELAFTEMLNVRSLSHRSRRTLGMLSTRAEDRPLGVQLLACEPDFLLKGMEVIAGYEFDLLDFNAACPVRKVTQRGEGAGLLKDTRKLNRLLKLIVKNSQVPVTVKLRTGWDKHCLNIKELVLRCRDAGVNAIFIHGRTKTDGYSGGVDYQAIAEAKRLLDIPLIASGDILSAHSAKKMLEETGCDGLLVARGALGNPWIFKELKGLSGENPPAAKPKPQELSETMLKHLAMCVDFHGEKVGVMVFRKFFNWYTKGLRRIRRFRQDSSGVRSKTAMQELIRSAVESGGFS